MAEDDKKELARLDGLIKEASDEYDRLDNNADGGRAQERASRSLERLNALRTTLLDKYKPNR